MLSPVLWTQTLAFPLPFIQGPFCTLKAGIVCSRPMEQHSLKQLKVHYVSGTCSYLLIANAGAAGRLL